MPSDNPLPRINKNYINLGVWFKQFDFCLVKEIYTLIYPVKGNTKHMDEWAQVSLTSFSGKVGAWIIISRIAGRHGPLLHQRKTRGSICRAESTTHCFPLLAAILKFTTQVYLTNSSNNSHSELLQHNIGFFMNLKWMQLVLWVLYSEDLPQQCYWLMSQIGPHTFSSVKIFVHASGSHWSML